LGALDERIFVPLLLYARHEEGWECAYLDQLLEALELPGLELHPGYQLRVQTLGKFQVWRGSELIPASGWQREKARQLFQILLTYRQAPLDRDQICGISGQRPIRPLASATSK
jgi:LuxR family transcriptional regulator, maltose regulon positive regulatory protein